MRWGETIGLEHDYVHEDQIHVEWQLREIRSTFHRLPPKDDSYRSPHWNPACPSTSRRSWRTCWPSRSRPSPGSGGPVRASMAAAGTMCSSVRTAAIRGAATTPAACSARPVMAGTSRSPANRLGSPSSMPPSGRASPSPPGRQPSQACRTPGREDGASARHTRPVRPHFRPDARGPQTRPPGPLGGLAPRAGHLPRALTRPAARRASRVLSRASTGANDTARHPAGPPSTGRQGEDDLPNSSQNSGRVPPQELG